MHIQTRIVDLIPDKDNIITTRLLIPTSDIGCLEGRDGLLSDMRRLTGANIQILPREELPVCVSGDDVIVQVCHMFVAHLSSHYLRDLLGSFIFG